MAISDERRSLIIRQKKIGESTRAKKKPSKGLRGTVPPVVLHSRVGLDVCCESAVQLNLRL